MYPARDVMFGDVAAVPEVRAFAYRGMMLATVVILTLLAAGPTS
jgi:hypothetical protein